MKKTKIILGALGVIIFVGAIASCGNDEATTTFVPAPQETEIKEVVQPILEEKPGITSAEFKKIKNGMSYEEVVKIVGTDGELISETGEKGSHYYTVMYQWYGETGLGANANAMFQGGKLASKAQFGLE